jgi:hypothetical protein
MGRYAEERRQKTHAQQAPRAFEGRPISLYKPVQVTTASTVNAVLLYAHAVPDRTESAAFPIG